MPIAPNKNYVTLEFEYTAAEDPQIQMRVKFHYIDGSPVISLSQENDKWLDLPASLFPDVTDHLRERGMLNPPRNRAYTSSTSTSFASSPAHSSTVLPTPHIVRSQSQDHPLDAVDHPLESFEHLSALAAKTTTNPSHGVPPPEDMHVIESRPVLRGAESAIHRKAMSGGGSIKRV